MGPQKTLYGADVRIHMLLHIWSFFKSICSHRPRFIALAEFKSQKVLGPPDSDLVLDERGPIREYTQKPNKVTLQVREAFPMIPAGVVLRILALGLGGGEATGYRCCHGAV